jgi:hypothetical protein
VRATIYLNPGMMLYEIRFFNQDYYLSIETGEQEWLRRTPGTEIPPAFQLGVEEMDALVEGIKIAKHLTEVSEVGNASYLHGQLDATKDAMYLEQERVRDVMDRLIMFATGQPSSPRE